VTAATVTVTEAFVYVGGTLSLTQSINQSLLLEDRERIIEIT